MKYVVRSLTPPVLLVVLVESDIALGMFGTHNWWVRIYLGWFLCGLLGATMLHLKESASPHSDRSDLVLIVPVIVGAAFMGPALLVIAKREMRLKPELSLEP